MHLSKLSASVLLGGFLVISTACSQPATAIVVAIDSDMSVPAELSSVRVEVGGAACSGASCAHDFELSGASAVALPFSLTVTPAGEPGPLALVVRGRDPSGADRVVRTVRSSFLTGRTLLLQVTLDRACLDSLACGDGSTCIDGACATDQIDASTLHDVTPGQELRFDGSVRGDAGTDAGTDAATIDAPGLDVGMIPRTCADVPSGTPSGAFTIDPDGPGGEEPFLDWCEMSADGGGWTLIAKIDPSAVPARLAFDEPVWTGGPEMRFGTADLSVSNALLASYWSVHASTLRIVMAPAATPTATRTLVTLLDSPTTLRMAMEGSGHVALDASTTQWATLVGAPDPGAATCGVSGVPAERPTAAPVLHVRIGYLWGDTSDCAQPAFWAGIGASGTSCSHPVASPAGGGRLCGTGAQRHDYPLVAWLFAR